MPALTRSKRPGFSLLELLIVLGLGAFLLGLLLPAVQKGKEAANRADCVNNLRSLVLASHNAHDQYGFFPPITGDYPKKKKQFGTLFFHLLPYLEQGNVYEGAKGSVWNNQTQAVRVALFLCPSDPSAPAKNLYKGWLATSSYAGNWQLFGDKGRQIATITDGTSITIMFTERYQMCKGNPCGWAYPAKYYWAPMFAYYGQGKFQTTPAAGVCDPALAQTPHPKGIQVGMADGSARVISPSISAQTWWYACTPAGGESLGSDFDD
jgi:prepilin-type N-terminal cleavage/methylation domain-containing protein